MTIPWPSSRIVIAVAVGMLAAYAALHGFTKLAVVGTIGMVFLLVTLRFPFYGLLAWVLLSPAVDERFRVSLPVGLPDLTFTRLAVVSIVLALGLQTMFGGRRLARPGAVEAFMAILVVVCVLDIALRGESIGSISLIYFDEYIAPFLFFFAAKNLVTNERELRSLAYTLVGLGVYLGLYGAYQYAMHTGLGVSQTQIGIVAHHLTEGRARGPFANSVEYGGVLALTFIWALYAWHSTRTRPGRLLTASSLLCMGFGVLFSLTRAVWLGLVASVVLTAFLQPRLRKPIVATSSVIIAVLFGVFLFSLSASSRLQERAASLEPIYIRIVMYSAAASMISDAPLIGYGRGEDAFIEGRREHLSSVGTIDAEWGNLAGPPHNIYLYVALQWGMLGLLPYLAIFALLLKSSHELNRLTEDTDHPIRWLNSLFNATLLLYLLMGMFDDVSAFPTLTSLFFIVAGIVSGANCRLAEAERIPHLARI